MTVVIDPETANAFLALDRVALVGASNEPKHFSNAIYRALKDHGVAVVRVNPRETEVMGDGCYKSVAAVPGELEGVIVMVRRDTAVQIVRECIERGVAHVWLFKGLGGEGAVSDEAVALCEAHGVDVIAGACPMMFLRPVKGFHRFHLGVRRLRGDVAKAS